MSPRRSFQPSEIDPGRGDDGFEALAAARQLERYADAALPAWTPAFTDQVMAAVAAEPAPAPVRATIVAFQTGRLSNALSALRDVWRVAWSGGRPISARATALALVAVLLLGLSSIGGFTAVAAWNALNSHPAPVVVPSPSPSPSPSASLSPTASPAVTPAPATATPNGGGQPGRMPSSMPSMWNSETPYPWDTHMPTDTHHPGMTEHPWSSQMPGSGGNHW